MTINIAINKQVDLIYLAQSPFNFFSRCISLFIPLAAVSAVVILAGCKINIDHGDAQELKGSGIKLTENRIVGDFSTLENTSPFDVEISPSTEKKVSISGDDNLVKEVETVVENHRLMIRLKNKPSVRFSWNQSPVVIHVQAMGLTEIENNGSGSLAANQLRAEQMKLISANSGDVTVSGSVTHLNAEISGSGDLNLADLQIKNLALAIEGSGDTELSQVTQSLHLKSNGSGNLKADHLQLNDLTIEQNGSGDIDLQGTVSSLQANLSGSGNFRLGHLIAEKSEIIINGSGDVTLIGDVQQFSIRVNGSGEFDGADLNVGQLDVMGSGSGNISFHTVRARSDVELSGSGEFQAQFNDAAELKLTLNGPGNTHLKGRAKNLYAVLTGSGDLQAAELLLDHASVKVTGSGTAEVNVKSVDKNKSATNSATASRVVKIDRNGVLENP